MPKVKCMKKWCVIDQKENDEFLTVCESKEVALEQAGHDWDRMTDIDRKHRTCFFVGLCNVDESGNYFEDENGNIDADVYEIAKEWC